MQPDPAELRRYYASLSDEALLEIERGDLTPVAQACYDSELAERQLSEESDVDEPSHADSFRDDSLDDGGFEDEPDWLTDAACACSFDSSPGNDSAPDVDEARSVLEAAGIPCQAITREVETESAERRRYSYDLMVPGALNLQAVSILDKDFFNPRLEAEWRAHFADLSDEELRALNLRDLTIGMLDRAERLTRVYKDELARR